jgi:integrase/recombinase XerD
MTKDLIVTSAATPAAPGQALARVGRFELPRAKNFIEKSLSEDTRRAYTRALLDFFSFIRKPPAQVTVEDVIAYRDDLVKNKRRKARTVNMKLSVVRAYFGYLKAAGDIEINPADTKLVSVPPPPDDMAGRSLTHQEVTRLINAPDRSKAEGARDHALLLVLARTSLRVSEVGNLRVSSIVWSHGRWTARVKVKGGRERTIPLPKDVKQAIDHYLKLDAGRRQHFHCDGDDAFISLRGLSQAAATLGHRRVSGRE